MKISTILLAGAFAILSTAVLAQSNSSEKTQKSMTGDPAASSANPNPDTTGMAPNRTWGPASTSGGKDENRDQGRDKMPESNMSVKQPQEQQKR